MKILILTFYFPPDLSAGSFRAGQLVSALKKAGDKDDLVEIISTRPNRYSTFRPEKETEKDEDNIKIHRIELPNHKNGMRDQALAFIYFAKEVFKLTCRKDYDLVFATSSRLMTGALGAVISKKSKSRYHLDVRDIFTDTIFDVIKKKFLIKMILPFLKFIEAWTFKSADEINVVSKGFINYVAKISPHAILTTFTNGIDEEFLNRNFLNKVETQKTCITYAGNFGESQGLQYIIPEAAIKTEKYVEYKLIGDGGKKYELISALKNVGAKNVELYDPVNRSSLLNIYTNSDILFFCLNDKEAFLKVLPSKLFEYAATGKPILAGVAGYASDFIQKNIKGCETFHPGSTSDMINKLNILMAGPKHFDRTEFKEKFSREKIMQAYAIHLLKKKR